MGVGSVLLVVGCGQVHRQMTIQSNPSGAVAYLNGQEVGRTPCTVDFTWYGRYEVILRKDGYQTLKTTQYVASPWWQWIPVDLAADVVPGNKYDRKQYSFSMIQQPETGVAPTILMDRAASLKPLLESGEFTRKPTTRPTTMPASTLPAAK